MPRQNIPSESTPPHVDFGSNLYNFIRSDDDTLHDRVPGAWLGDSDNEEFSDPSMTRSKARAIAKEALADLRRAAAEAEDERLNRQTLKARHAAEGRRSASAAAKGEEKATHHPMSIRAILAQDNATNTNAPTSSSRHASIDPSLVSAGSYEKLIHDVPAQGNASNTSIGAPRRPCNGSPLNSGGQSASQADTHERGFLTLMDDFNARGGAHTAATRRLVDGGFIGEGQLAAAAARAKSRADARVLDGEVAQQDRLAAARARLAAEGRVVAPVSQQTSSSEPHAVKGVPPMAVRPRPAQPCATVGPSRLLTRKMERCVPAGTAHPSLSTADGVKQPLQNNVVIDSSPTGGPKPGIEAAHRSTSHPVSRTLRIYDYGQAPKPSSTKLATAAASTTTSTTPSQSVREKARAIAHRYASAAKSSGKPAQKVAAQKLAQGPKPIDFDAEKGPSTKLTDANKTTGATTSQSINMKIQANLDHYGEAMGAMDDASAAAFVAHKLQEDTDRAQFGAGRKPSAKLTAATETNFTARSQSVNVKVQAILRRYGDAMSALDEASVASFVAHKLKQDTDRAGFDVGKMPSITAQLTTTTTTKVQGKKGPATEPDVVKTDESDDGFDVVNSKGPSAANGSPLPDADLIMDQLDVQISPTPNGFQGWDDDYDSDESEEWDLGGLAEWKWVGEKSAKESSTAEGQA